MRKARKNRLYRDVEFLAGIRPFRNFRNLESLGRASGYISGQFAASGFRVEEQAWQAAGNEYRNIIASWQKGKPRRLIIGAHYDVCGDQPGADDNASGVAGLLETARLVSEHRPDMDYGIDFVAYCLEEPPFFASGEMGSYIHAKSLHDQQADVLGMICLEMIGYFSDEPGSQGFPSPEMAAKYPDTGDCIVVVGIEKCGDFNGTIHRLMREGAVIRVERADFPDHSGLAGLSDQRSYWEFGYDALMINDTSFLRNPHYHRGSDTIGSLDFSRMAAVVDSCYHAVTNLG
jgi:hypothetical protein